jgi:hypothetical protein
MIDRIFTILMISSLAAMLAACVGGKPASAAVLSSITLMPVHPAVERGATQQFTAIGTFSDDTVRDLTTSVTWSSSDVDVITISNDAGSQGLARTVAAGKCTVTATSGSIHASTTVAATVTTGRETPAVTGIGATPGDGQGTCTGGFPQALQSVSDGDASGAGSRMDGLRRNL